MKPQKGCVITFGLFVLGLLVILLGYLGFRNFEAASQRAGGPSLQVISPKPNETAGVQSQILVQVNAAARGNPVALLRFYADGFLAGEQRGPGENLIGIWKWAPPTEGSHTLAFLAYNQRGEANMTSMTVMAIPAADSDTDGVPDAQDVCPNQTGPAESKGCLLADDRDQDGIADAQDACPDQAGELEDHGCPPASLPDRDRDGVPDSTDRCPDQPGLPEWEGCPAGAWVADRDGDGIPDFLDTCPDGAGSLEASGCPASTPQDTDGDGVTDELDACDDQPGPPETAGCPIDGDRDGDGIPDDRDECPDEPGLAGFHGCLPEGWDTDADGDGVMDFLDRCDDQPGPAENLGCPLPDDRDGDGVADADDNCPDVEGPASNQGCPNMMAPIFPGLVSLVSVDVCTIFPSACDPDGDGLTGAEDACPDQVGPADLHGCPLFPLDQDGDGVLDEYDNCPTQAGDPALLGCPDEHDRDRDGVSLEFDACPDQAGPPENHGCPRPGSVANVEIEILGLNTNAGWGGINCYLSLPGYSRIRLPETDYLESFDEDSWRLGDRSSGTVSMTEDGLIAFDALCWGLPGDPSVLPQPLGEISRSHAFGDWDNQVRFARAEGAGGWIELVYHMCRGSCP